MARPTVFAPGWEERYDNAVFTNAIVPISEAIRDDAARYAPKDTGDLADSIDIEYTRSGSRIGSNLDYAMATEFGSQEHLIVSHGNYPLRNRETGEVFGRAVMHPGTPEQPFLRPALYTRRSL